MSLGEKHELWLNWHCVGRIYKLKHEQHKAQTKTKLTNGQSPESMEIQEDQQSYTTEKT